MNAKCVGITQYGEPCKHKAKENGRCGVHLKVLNDNGPNTTELMELRYKHYKQYAMLNTKFSNELINETDDQKKIEIRDRHVIERMRLETKQQEEVTALRQKHREEIRRTGVDPDRQARQIRDERNRLRNEERNQMMLNRVNAMRNGVLAEQAQALAAIAAGRQANGGNGDPNHNLAAFAKDNQNVHTTTIVKKTKDIVDKILKIKVPEEYRWNMKYCSKTPGEIIVDCKLTPKAAWQMQAKYSQDEDIYEMGKGIYGKVLDGVWQFVKTSKDKADIISALRQELEDSIGMCAQGNLSRICNILAGFMEGIGSQESLAEILGRELPLLMNIDDVRVRMKEAINLLSMNGVPKQEWLVWIDPLFDDLEDGPLREIAFKIIS